jgi:hypothetical protein
VFDQADPPEGYEHYEGYTNVMFGAVAMRTSVVIVPRCEASPHERPLRITPSAPTMACFLER